MGGLAIELQESENGFSLFIPEKMRADRPIQIYVPTNDIHTHNIITVSAGSSADVLLYDGTSDANSPARKDTTEIVLCTDASLNLVRLQHARQADLSTETAVQQATGSRMQVHYVSLGGAVRNSLQVCLSGENAEHIARGISFTCGAEHIENEVRIEHASPCCRSNQLFRHILSDASTGAFTGRIVVNEDAQKTAAYQRSSNILLDPKAKMHIHPQLEIYADDVKCSHGATVGQLNADVLFYLQARGIGMEQAQRILLQAFAEEILEDISNALIKEEMKQFLKQKLKINAAN
jgi:Fe-S cluster assembly protein SufD